MAYALLAQKFSSGSSKEFLYYKALVVREVFTASGPVQIDALVLVRPCPAHF